MLTQIVARHKHHHNTHHQQRQMRIGVYECKNVVISLGTHYNVHIGTMPAVQCSCVRVSLTLLWACIARLLQRNLTYVVWLTAKVYCPCLLFFRCTYLCNICDAKAAYTVCTYLLHVSREGLPEKKVYYVDIYHYHEWEEFHTIAI